MRREMASKAAACGLRAHSGWAAAVVLTGPAESPALVERLKIDMTDPQLSGCEQPYHAAEGLALQAAQSLLKRYRSSANLLARRALGSLMERVRGRGYQLMGSGILASSGRRGTTLEATLSSHMLIHAADGDHFRDALAQASEHYDLAVLRIPERELLKEAAAALGLPSEALQERVAELGRPVGPPWGQDQKYAALVAWLVLQSHGRSRRRRRPARRGRS